jgi:hypothetical protein
VGHPRTRVRVHDLSVVIGPRDVCHRPCDPGCAARPIWQHRRAWPP